MFVSEVGFVGMVNVTWQILWDLMDVHIDFPSRGRVEVGQYLFFSAVLKIGGNIHHLQCHIFSSRLHTMKLHMSACSHKPLCILVGVHSVRVGGMREQGAVGPGHTRTILMAQRLYPWPAQDNPVIWSLTGDNEIPWIHLTCKLEAGSLRILCKLSRYFVETYSSGLWLTLCREMRVSRLVDDGGEAGRVAQEVLVQALLLLHCNCRKCKFL